MVIKDYHKFIQSCVLCFFSYKIEIYCFWINQLWIFSVYINQAHSDICALKLTIKTDNIPNRSDHIWCSLRDEHIGVGLRNVTTSQPSEVF